MIKLSKGKIIIRWQ